MESLSANYRGVRFERKTFIIRIRGIKPTSPGRKSGDHISKGRETRPASRFASFRLVSKFFSPFILKYGFFIVLTYKDEFFYEKIF